MSKDPALRLGRLLANLGYGSRREVQIMANNGRIRLDGEVLRDMDKRVPLTPDFAARLRFDNAPIDPLPGMVLMLNKPLGVTCSHNDAGPLVFRLLPERWQRRDPKISAVGRLDKETSGLLLMTDDGAFLHKIISPRTHIPKRYIATLDRPLNGNEAEIFASGTLMLDSEDKPLLPATLDVLGEREAAITVTEGRYHQIRRMFAAVGNHVVGLKRVAVGGLVLPEGLAEGEFVVLGEAEKAAVMGGGT